MGAIRQPFVSCVDAALSRRAELFRPTRPLRATAVFLRWDLSTQSSHMRDVSAWLDRLSTQVKVSRYFVDNGGNKEDLPPPPWRPVEGNNEVREFSGWREGIHQAIADGNRPDVWIMINDRYYASDYPFMRRINPATLYVVYRSKGLAGLLDRYPAPVYSFGMQIWKWIRTSLWVIAADTLDLIGGSVCCVGHSDMGSIFEEPYREDRFPFRDEGPVDRLHGDYLLDFLSSASSTDYVGKWYRCFELSGETWGEFQSKVLSILNEQLLSARVLEQGLPLIHLTAAFRLGLLRARVRALDAAIEGLGRHRCFGNDRAWRTGSELMWALAHVSCCSRVTWKRKS